MLSRLKPLGEGVMIALDALRANKVRAALTILGIAIGVFVVVIISAAIHGVNRSIAYEFEKAGPTTFFMSRFPITLAACDDTEDTCKWRNNPPLRMEEAEAIKRLPSIHGVTIAEPTASRNTPKREDNVSPSGAPFRSTCTGHRRRLGRLVSGPQRFKIGCGGGYVPLATVAA